uniref:rRNA-processing protein FYV7 n=1 Tax=Blastobotrys adeninivorans TaxID=409370 RepID=A0A060T1U9_BLAAD
MEHVKNRTHDRRKAKTTEIKRSLTHRARLRKAYFKMLEKEGEPEQGPSKEAHSEDEQDEGKTNETSHASEQGPSYAERMQKIRDRKRAKREEKRQRIIAQREDRERKEALRQKHRKQMTKYTQKGQPLMSSRIDRLLDKIKEKN